MSFWKDKSVLVTGATGLVGSWLVHELLKQGSNVTALVLDNDPASELCRSGDIDRISVVNGNLSSYHDVARSMYTNECTEVFYLGAQTIVGTALLDPISTFESNIQVTWNVLEAVRQSEGMVKAVVVASSDKAYGSSRNLPYLEDHPLHGDGPYDVSKSCTDLLAQSYGNTYGLPVTVARCGNIYGGGDLNWSRIVPGTIRDLVLKKQPVLRSDGTFIRDYVHVDDVISGYMKLAEVSQEKKLNGEAFNFSRNEPLSVKALYEFICQATVGNYVEPLILNTAKSEIKDQHLNSTKAKTALGWSSSVSITDGLTKTVDWYRKYLLGSVNI
ncbi:MAG: NAD-dependent epimerase/dehydratase family protein [bacterium]